MRSQNGPISRYIVSHELAEDRPTSSGVAQGVGRIIDISAIAETARAAKRVQELLVGLKRRQGGKHPSISCSAKGGIDCHSRSCRRQAVISDRFGVWIHEPLHSPLPSPFEVPGL